MKKVTDYIFLKSKPQKADLVLVFGTRHPEAINKAHELYQAGLVPKILISGGINKVTGKNEAEDMGKELIELGVNTKDLILEDKSTNSLENVLFSQKVIEEKIGFGNIKKIIFVTKHYHSRRALMTLKKYFPKDIELIPVTYDVYGFTKDDWSESNIGREKVNEELAKIKKYFGKIN